MNDENAAIWREALLLQGETDLVESGIRELAEYFGVSRERALAECRDALAGSKREWQSAPRRTHGQIVDFYRRTRSYLFEHIWWHATDVETNAANVEILNFALRRGAREYLDFGSGVGSNAILFARRGFRVTLADVSETMMDFARWRLARRGLEASFIDLNLDRLPGRRFDFATAVDVLEHLADPSREMESIAGSLEIGGAFVFNCHTDWDAERPMHILQSAAPVLSEIRLNGLRECGPDAEPLRRLDFRAVERGSQSRIDDWVCGAYDRLIYNRIFWAGRDRPGDDGLAPQRPVHPQRIYFERIKQRLNGQSRWLDVGCGRHLAPWWMKEQVETDAEMRARSQMIAGVDSDFAALRDNRACSVRLMADARALPFAGGSFDLATANMVFEHLASPLATAREIRRVLAKGGRLIALTPNWLDIVTIAARLAPNRWHPAVVSRIEARNEADVYPAHFRLNSPAAVERILREAGFVKRRIELLEHPDVYSRAPVVARLESGWHALARRWPALRGVLMIEAEAD
jgi:SAM-dependent methyltransferase